MYKKISIIAYLNIFIVMLINFFHEAIEAVSDTFLFVLLILYALLNGVYIQRELNKQKKLEVGLKTEKIFNDMIVDSIPTGIVVIDPDGKIEFVNEAVGKILGSTDTAGLNILQFDTIIESGLKKRLDQAIKGNASMIKAFEYTSFTSRETRILDVSIKPFEFIESIQRHRVIMLIDDVTHSHQLMHKIDQQYLGMFKSFVKFIDAKDAYTGKHSNNVTYYTELILNELELSYEAQENIRIAAALHDIGKIGIKENILNKPGKLTYDEYNEMKKHPVIGAELLGEIEDYQEVAMIIRYHHEWWNGAGYPERLKAEEIPLGAQIIAIADAYDAITSDRVYRKALSQMEAIKILKDQRWTQFNGELVDRFIHLILMGNEEYEKLG